ncbi:hypothetical protein F4819DRAFT_488702 [Hypoxylon fuscum]|nr:hypothetical protein F4819DRAFT_488702 [Hypoxylon fuscum]
MEWTVDDRFATYIQYKKDTEAIAEWLAYNYRKCGYQVGAPESTPPINAPSTRLKEKATKQNYTINVSDFRRMANTIANYKPKIEIPKAIDQLFSRTIDARRRFLHLHHGHCHSEEESNKRHEHFTSVLITTWEILHPFKPPRTSHATKRPTDILKPKTIGDLTNRFSGLEIDQSLENDTDPDSATNQDGNDFRLAHVAPTMSRL